MMPANAESIIEPDAVKPGIRSRRQTTHRGKFPASRLNRHSTRRRPVWCWIHGSIFAPIRPIVRAMLGRDESMFARMKKDAPKMRPCWRHLGKDGVNMTKVDQSCAHHAPNMDKDESIFGEAGVHLRSVMAKVGYRMDRMFPA